MENNFQRSTHVDNVPGIMINQFPNDRLVKLLASPAIERCSQNFAVGISIISPGRIHEQHAHSSEEVIYILQGEGAICINDREKINLSRGIVVILQPDEKHSITASGSQDLHCLWIYSPTGPESKFIGGAGCAPIQERMDI